MKETWWYFVLDFAVLMIDRFEQKDTDGWSGHKEIPEEDYRERAIRNINKGDYIDAANLCALANYAKIHKDDKP